ncbi:unnamed protein product, partial [Acidithrix sp. C25]
VINPKLHFVEIPHISIPFDSARATSAGKSRQHVSLGSGEVLVH